MTYDSLFKIVIKPQDEKYYTEIKDYINEYENLMSNNGNIVGTDFATLTQNIEGHSVKYQIWILYPDERFKEMQEGYARGGHIGIIIGDNADKVDEMASDLTKILKEVKLIKKPEELLDVLRESIKQNYF